MKTFLSWAVAVLFCVFLFVGGFGVGWFVRDKNLFGAPDIEQTEPNDDQEQGGMLPDVGDEGTVQNGVKLMYMEIPFNLYDEYGVSPLAESACMITAKVECSGLNLFDEAKAVKWSDVTFKNPSSAWASGKNVSDYVSSRTVENSIILSCLKAFGEQMQVVVTSKFDETKSRTIPIDYLDKFEISALTFNGVAITDDDSTAKITYYTSQEKSYTLAAVGEHSEAYTLAREFTVMINAFDYEGMPDPGYAGDSFFLLNAFMFGANMDSDDSISVVLDGVFDSRYHEQTFIYLMEKGNIDMKDAKSIVSSLSSFVQDKAGKMRVTVNGVDHGYIILEDVSELEVWMASVSGGFTMTTDRNNVTF